MKKDKMGALDVDGAPFPMDPELLRRAVNEMMEKGEIIAVLIRKDESILVKMFFAPDDWGTTAAVIESFEMGASSLKGMLARRGH